MAKAVRFDTIGGPEVLRLVDVEIGDPGRAGDHGGVAVDA